MSHLASMVSSTIRPKTTTIKNIRRPLVEPTQYNNEGLNTFFSSLPTSSEANEKNNIFVDVYEYLLEGYNIPDLVEAKYNPSVYTKSLKQSVSDCGKIKVEDSPEENVIRSCDVLDGILSKAKSEKRSKMIFPSDRPQEEIEYETEIKTELELDTDLPPIFLNIPEIGEINLLDFLNITALIPTKITYKKYNLHDSDIIKFSPYVDKATLYNPIMFEKLTDAICNYLSMNLWRGSKKCGDNDDQTLIKVITPNLEDKFIIVGDIHGSLATFIRLIYRWNKMGIIDNNGNIQGTYKIIFLGDICDRGIWGYEIYLVLFFLFVKNNTDPNNMKFFINRGNHEEIHTNKSYGLLDDFQLRFGVKYYEKHYKNINYLFSLLHSAIIIKNPNNLKKFIYLCHGGYPIVRTEDVDESGKYYLFSYPLSEDELLRSNIIINNQDIVRKINDRRGFYNINTIRWNDFHGYYSSRIDDSDARMLIGQDLINQFTKLGCMFSIRAHQDNYGNSILLFKDKKIDSTQKPLSDLISKCDSADTKKCKGPITTLTIKENSEINVLNLHHGIDSNDALPVLTVSTNTDYERKLSRDSFCLLRFTEKSDILTAAIAPASLNFVQAKPPASAGAASLNFVQAKPPASAGAASLNFVPAKPTTIYNTSGGVPESKDDDEIIVPNFRNTNVNWLNKNNSKFHFNYGGSDITKIVPYFISISPKKTFNIFEANHLKGNFIDLLEFLNISTREQKYQLKQDLVRNKILLYNNSDIPIKLNLQNFFNEISKLSITTENKKILSFFSTQHFLNSVIYASISTPAYAMVNETHILIKQPNNEDIITIFKIEHGHFITIEINIKCPMVYLENPNNISSEEKIGEYFVNFKMEFSNNQKKEDINFLLDFDPKFNGKLTFLSIKKITKDIILRFVKLKKLKDFLNPDNVSILFDLFKEDNVIDIDPYLAYLFAVSKTTQSIWYVAFNREYNCFKLPTSINFPNSELNYRLKQMIITYYILCNEVANKKYVEDPSIFYKKPNIQKIDELIQLFPTELSNVSKSTYSNINSNKIKRNIKTKYDVWAKCENAMKWAVPEIEPMDINIMYSIFATFALTYEFDIIFVRHGYSCANLMKKVYGYGHTNYSDPELTLNARRIAVRYGELLKRYLKKYEGKTDLIVGSSPLIRTQQTADLMINPEKIFIVPHIAEVGSTVDNIPFDKAKQDSILASICSENIIVKQDYSFCNINKTSGYKYECFTKDRSDPKIFIDWLGKNYMNLYNIIPGDNYMKKQIIFFSHKHFINKLINLSGGKEIKDLHNFSSHRFHIKAEANNIINISYEGEIKYYSDYTGEIPSINKTFECSLESCRKPICNKTRKTCKQVLESQIGKIPTTSNFNKTYKNIIKTTVPSNNPQNRGFNRTYKKFSNVPASAGAASANTPTRKPLMKQTGTRKLNNSTLSPNVIGYEPSSLTSRITMNKPPSSNNKPKNFILPMGGENNSNYY